MPDTPGANPDKSEKIMSQMDVTRKDLADKLEKLEEKVTGTVASVTDLVEKVPETVDTVKETIAETVGAVSDTVHNTVEAVEGAVSSTVGAVQDLFNIPRHVDRHPWLMMGGSVLLGFLGGRLLLPRRQPAALPPSSAGEAAAPPPAPTYQAPAYQPPPAPSFEADHSSESEAEGSKEGWLGRLGDKFGGEISKVKGMALGTLLGVARDMISQWVPDTLRQDVKSVINNFTSDLGGKVFEQPILGGGGQSSPGGDGASHDQGDSHERSEQPEFEPAEAATTAMGRKGGRGRR